MDEDVGHTDSQLFRKEVRQWMNRWMRGDTTPVSALPLPENRRETAVDLCCLATLPSNAVNYRIHELFIPTAEPVKPRSLQSWETRRKRLIEELKEKVFRWFPREKISFKTAVSRNNGGWAGRYADYKDVTFDTNRASRSAPNSF